MANRRKTRAYNLTDAEAARLQASIRGHGDFDPVTVRAQRGYLVVASGGDAWPVARLTPLGASQYGLSFHRHNGQWQPMPSSPTSTRHPPFSRTRSQKRVCFRARQPSILNVVTN